MKKVLINGQLVEFAMFDTRQTLTEEKNPNFIGYSSTYYINGQKFTTEKPIKFYR